MSIGAATETMETNLSGRKKNTIDTGPKKRKEKWTNIHREREREREREPNKKRPKK